jgi:hypothetical protein
MHYLQLYMVPFLQALYVKVLCCKLVCLLFQTRFGDVPEGLYLVLHLPGKYMSTGENCH